MHPQNNIPTPALKRKRPDRVQREMLRAEAERTPATIQHDQIADAYHRGGRDALRVILVAVQAALAKHDSPRKAPESEGGHA